ncbi:MAG: translation initiation factor IF-3 [Candidatus Omnitrophota bacterium]
MNAYGGKRDYNSKDFTRVNDRIRAATVRLVDEEGNQLGVVEIREAVALAKEKGLDLVEVASKVSPPVCRIMDYSKFKYEQKKKQKLAKKKQHITHVKEIRFKPKIEEHDYQVKLKHIKEFLETKDRVRVVLRFRGRENAHKELGRALLDRIAKDSSGVGEMESSPQMMGRTMMMTILPKTEKEAIQKTEDEA